MWKNTGEQDRPQMTVLRMRISCWTPKATNTHSKFEILIPFPLQQWLQGRATLLRSRTLKLRSTEREENKKREAMCVQTQH
jgi:hypothetical protein